MKTAIASSGNSIESIADKRFGRCSFFCIYDTESKESQLFENPYKDMPSGVGVKVVEFLAEKGVKKVIAGDFGPKAGNTLSKLNIETQQLPDEEVTVKDIINNL